MLQKQQFPPCQQGPGGPPEPRDRKQEGGEPVGPFARGRHTFEPSARLIFILKYPDTHEDLRRSPWEYGGFSFWDQPMTLARWQDA